MVAWAEVDTLDVIRPVLPDCGDVHSMLDIREASTDPGAISSIRPGSKERLPALATLSFFIGIWGDFLTAEEKKMGQALALEGR